MPNIEKHAPGTFSWVELATTDQNAAKGFYTSLFGWAANDTPIGPNDLYTIFRIDSRDAAAGYTMRADEREMGIPSHWNLYIAVANADESAKRAGELGAKVLAAPFDVMDAGRMAVIQDPTGAIFQLWQAKRNQGIGIAGAEGTLCWADLSTPDPARAKPFYEGLFGWKISLGQNDTSGYLHLQNGEEFIGGIPPASQRPAGAPAHWLLYFWVGDVDACAAKAKDLGAAIYLPPMTIPNVGRMAIVADPQGAVFAIFNSTRQG
jgi:predicted enzyme related to lactoylglutathione lyase